MGQALGAARVAAVGFFCFALGCLGQPPIESAAPPLTVAEEPALPAVNDDPRIGAIAAPGARATDDRTLSPYFFVEHADPTVDPLPLQSTHADVRIAGTIADVQVTQIYKNE